MDESNGWTRRGFLRGTLILLCAPPVFTVGCADQDAGDGTDTVSGGPPDPIDGWSIPAGTSLTPARYAVLAAAADAMIPADDTTTGATVANAAWYIDQLLSAFQHDPPRIFPGGPYSGRHGGMDGFSSFQTLTRTEELRWRTYIEGSLGLPEREWNGPVKGLVDLYPEQLDAIDGVARDTYGVGFGALTVPERAEILDGADPAFVAMLWGHVVEGTWGDPVYGGNADGSGWAMIDYEGDRQPVGFSARQMSNPEEG